MKLRIQGNRIRVRLTQSEVARIGDGQRVEQTTRLSPTVSFTSAVQSSPTTTTTLVTFIDNTLVIWLPIDVARAWATGDEVGVSATVDVGDGQSLAILVEKDFQCLHGDERTKDAYPNPRA